ncbi:MAG: hypothetical protein R3B09_27100 [Nannocystaceae bacterium]
MDPRGPRLDDPRTLRIVYHGPGLSGRSSNLRYLFHHSGPDARGALESHDDPPGRRLELTVTPPRWTGADGRPLRLHLSTAPGSIDSPAARARLLDAADGVILVVDSQALRLDADLEALGSLEAALTRQGRSIEATPILYQYNKRDLPTALPVAELDAALGRGARPLVLASASIGEGVVESLRGITRRLVGR